MPMTIAPLFTRAEKSQPPNCLSTGQEINKVWCIHTMEYYSSFKKAEILTPVAIMD
jgi:hypothetical protein